MERLLRINITTCFLYEGVVRFVIGASCLLHSPDVAVL
jgi:hypothetical protein